MPTAIMNQSESWDAIPRTAGAGIKLSLLLNATACQISQSGIEINSIAKCVSLFAVMLKQMGQTLRLAELDHSSIIAEKAWEIASRGHRMFDEIEHMLDILRSTDTHESLRNIPFPQRVRWCFRKHHVTYLLAQVETLKLSLIVMLKVVHLGILVNTMSLSDPDRDETIAQEKAEAQNMIIVRFWSVKRLGRLWELVEQEALEAASDPTNQLIEAHYSSIICMVPITSSNNSHGLKPKKYSTFSFGDCDVDMSAMERSPKDMVQLSEVAVEALLFTQFPSLSHRKSLERGERSQEAYPTDGMNNTHVKSSSHRNRGSHLENIREDWRNPDSQDTRDQAARPRKKSSKYQAHVESTLGSDDSGHSSDSRKDDFIDGDSHNRKHHSKSRHGSHRRHRGSGKDAHESKQTDANPSGSHSPSLPKSSHFPTSHNPRQEYRPRGIQDSDRSGSKTLRNAPVASRGAHTVHFDLPDESESSFSSHHGSSSHRRSRDEAKERHRSLTRSATKGLLGVSAIAGFMDALEAFSVI